MLKLNALLINNYTLELVHKIAGNSQDCPAVVFLSHLIEKLDDVRKVHIPVKNYIPVLRNELDMFFS